MYVVIGGAGEVGYHVAKSLREERHDVAIIEKKSQAYERADALDVLAILGNAASPSALKEAGIDGADLFIGVTGVDEVNMLACAIAKTNGCKTIARIHNPEYIDQPVSMQKFKDIGIDIAICPELMSAIKTARVLTLPSTLDADVFAEERVHVFESLINSNSQVIGKTLKEINFPPNCNLVAIFRNSEVIVPKGDDVLLENDRIVTVVGNMDAVPRIEALLGNQVLITRKDAVERVMIYGASEIGLHLAKILQDKAKVVLIEESKHGSERASEMLSNAIVVHGSGVDRDLLIEEGISGVDAFVATTSKEEANILSCLLAKQYGAKKTVALIDKPEIKSKLEAMGIDLSISPILVTISSVLQYARISDLKLLSLSVLHEGDAQVLEVKVTERSRVVGKKLRKARFPANSVVGAIVRGDNVIIPRGDDTLQLNDKAIIFARTDTVPKIEKMF